jgi:hypothetical protein
MDLLSLAGPVGEMAATSFGITACGNGSNSLAVLTDHGVISTYQTR